MALSATLTKLCTTRALGFAVSAGLALYGQWRMQELCWGFWITGLLYSWCFVGIACIRIILFSDHLQVLQSIKTTALLPFFQSMPAWLFSCCAAFFSLLISCIALYAYTWLFSFYGLFLSVFAEMEPRSLFGRNGFINSDFFTPVAYLARLCWPMALGSIIADREHFLNSSPWQLLLKPFSRQVALLHVAILTMPFIALLSWMLFEDSYQPVTVLFLLALFYFLPRPVADPPA
jgi:hypothetical protein